MEMSYGGTLVMPKSYAVMDQEEMCYVEGGVLPHLLITGGVLYVVGYNCSTGFTRTVRKGNKKVNVTFTPTKLQKNVGKALKVGGLSCVGSSLSVKIGLVFSILTGLATTKWD